MLRKRWRSRAFGGLTLGLLGMPAGYLSGSILAVAAASLAGRPMLIPVPLMRVLMTLIGVSLGAVVTPETLHGMASYPLSIGVLLVACACISLVGTAYLRAVHGWDTVTAYLAAAPGGLSQVMAIGIEINADVRAIAIVQTIRVVIIAVCLPALLVIVWSRSATPRAASAARSIRRSSASWRCSLLCPTAAAILPPIASVFPAACCSAR